ncbi:MAG: patatin family protein [Propionibacteriaceae bacterium]|nr:patatin family protein [Propionibacteriaceae bacterium]
MTNNVTDVALIFEGGGMRGSYTAAVVRTLLAAGLYFDWVAGISAGSSHLANYLSRDAHRAEMSFVDFTADPKFGNIGTFVRGQGLFNAHYIYEQTSAPGQALPFDFSTFQLNPATRRIGSFEADTGQAVYWGKEDMRTLHQLMREVRASSTMPILMPPVKFNGHTYVDGAIGPSGGIALDAARRDGLTRFFVVMTRERSYIKPPSRMPRLYKTWFRRFPAVAEALIERPRNYNQTREELFDLESSGQALLFVPDQMTVRNNTRSVPELRESFEAGLVQARRELPRWRDFLGL